MAGKFTNLRYDQEAYNEEINRSTCPLMYKLDPNYAVNCKPCFAENGPRGGHDNAVVAGQQIDVDSTLRGINRLNSRANRLQTPKSLDQYSTIMPSNCHNSIESEHTRFTHPSYDIRGMNVRDMRFGYPLHDPQCQIFENFGVNTRLQAKDDHKALWHVPLDQKDLLPTEKLRPAKNCTVSLNCNYAPYSSVNY